MNLGKKKMLAMRALKIGKERIVFVKPRLDEIKEAITKQDIRDLYRSGAIVIKDIAGKKKIKAKGIRNAGSIRKKVNKRKKEYVAITRKLRKYVAHMKGKEEITPEQVKGIRKKIRNREFRSRAYLKDYVGRLND